MIRFFCLLMLCTSLSAVELETLAGQVLMIHVQGGEVDEETAELLHDVQPGAVLLFRWANELSSPEQVRALNTQLQDASPHPLLIAVDQEGGRVTRLRDGFIHVPPAAQVAATLTPEETSQLALASGLEMREVGIHMNLAPVADIFSNPENTVIGDRSYGTDADEVIPYVRAALSGFEKAGLLPCLKHFPGHGDTKVDSHYGLPDSDKTLEQLEANELKPFRALRDAPFIMSAHIYLPEIDEDYCATLSRRIITGILREQIGFDGVVISDSLVMKGVLKQAGTPEEAAVQALLAGCDMLCIAGRVDERPLDPDRYRSIHTAIISAVESGRLPRRRLENAFERIQRAKQKIDFPNLSR